MGSIAKFYLNEFINNISIMSVKEAIHIRDIRRKTINIVFNRFIKYAKNLKNK